MPCQMNWKWIFLQEARRRFDEENAALLVNARIIKKTLYKQIREKFELSHILPNENGIIYYTYFEILFPLENIKNIKFKRNSS